AGGRSRGRAAAGAGGIVARGGAVADSWITTNSFSACSGDQSSAHLFRAGPHASHANRASPPCPEILISSGDAHIGVTHENDLRCHGVGRACPGPRLGTDRSAAALRGAWTGSPKSRCGHEGREGDRPRSGSLDPK